MNLTPHINEKDMDQLRTEQVQKKKNEFHLIGEERRIKGHTLFCFNLVKREIKVAPMNQECMLGLDGSVIYKNNVTVEKDCVYIQALNEKNARKKLIKMGYILERSKYEIENADRLLAKRQEQLKEIRKKKTKEKQL